MTPETGSTVIQEIHPSGRVKLLPLPVALPGKCIICGASDNNDGRQYIDFGFEIEYYGVVYFCSHCMAETAAAIGYVSPEISDVIYKDMVRHSNELDELGAENVKLRVALSQLDFLGSHGTIVDDFDPGIEESVEPKGSDDSKSPKQATKSGRTNVPKTGKPVIKSTDIDLEDFV